MKRYRRGLAGNRTGGRDGVQSPQMWKIVVENACDHGYPVVYYDPLMRFSTTASKFPQFVLDSRMVLVYTTFAVKNAADNARLAEQPRAEEVMLPNVWPNRKVNMSL